MWLLGDLTGEVRFGGGILDKLKHLHQPKGAKKGDDSVGGQFAPKDETAPVVPTAPRDNVPDFAPFEGDAWNTYHAAREAIRRNEFESAILVTADGEFLENTQNKTKSVGLSWRMRRKAKGGWVLHNHPTQPEGIAERPFSPNDLAMAGTQHIAGMEVVTEHKVFRAYPGAKGWADAGQVIEATNRAGVAFLDGLKKQGKSPKGIREMLRVLKKMDNEQFYRDVYGILTVSGLLRIEEIAK